MKSVGRILAKGLKDHRYFRLARASTAAVIFGEHSGPPDLLFDSLMLYLSQSEHDLLPTALQEAFVGNDEEELLGLMDCMGEQESCACSGCPQCSSTQNMHWKILQRLQDQYSESFSPVYKI